MKAPMPADPTPMFADEYKYESGTVVVLAVRGTMNDLSAAIGVGSAGIGASKIFARITPQS
jgi:hypothetical protein